MAFCQTSRAPAALRFAGALSELPVFTETTAETGVVEHEDERPRESNRRAIVVQRRPPLDRRAIADGDRGAVPHLDVRLRGSDARPVIAHGRWADERLLIWLLHVHRVGGEEPGRRSSVTPEPCVAVGSEPLGRGHWHRRPNLAFARSAVNRTPAACRRGRPNWRLRGRATGPEAVGYQRLTPCGRARRNILCQQRRAQGRERRHRANNRVGSAARKRYCVTNHPTFTWTAALEQKSVNLFGCSVALNRERDDGRQIHANSREDHCAENNAA